MGKYLKEIGNPLGIIGFFLVLVEGIAGMVIVNSSLPTFLNTILVIFTVTFPILVLIAFFKLVTEHHEKLYAPKDYADETNFVKTFYNFESKQSNEIIVGNQTQNISQIKSESTIIEEFDIIEEDISVSNLANASSLVNQYINIGYEASIYNSECSSTKDNTAIWLGTQVSLRNAKEIIKIAHEYYPHLKYIHLSTDGDNTPPERIHRQVYIGGATSTAKRYGLEEWSNEDFIKLQNVNSLNSLHKLIRSKYSRNNYFICNKHSSKGAQGLST